MANEILILEKLNEISSKLSEQNLLQKTVLNFNEACAYLDVSSAVLYHLIGSGQLCGILSHKNELHFKRQNLDNWMLQKYRLEKYRLKRVFTTLVSLIWKIISIVAGA